MYSFDKIQSGFGKFQNTLGENEEKAVYSEDLGRIQTPKGREIYSIND